MRDKLIEPYMELIRNFLSRAVDATTFEHAYLDMFKNARVTLSTEVFETLDQLFADVDAFCPDPESCDDDDLTEQQLRDKCLEALKKLESI